MAALYPRSTLTYLYDKPRVSLRDTLLSIPLSQEIRDSLTAISPFIHLMEEGQKMEEDQKNTKKEASIAELLGTPEAAEIDFEPPRLEFDRRRQPKGPSPRIDAQRSEESSTI